MACQKPQVQAPKCATVDDEIDERYGDFHQPCASYWLRRECLELTDSGMGVEVYLLFFAEMASD